MANAQKSKERLAKAKRKKVIRTRLLYGGIGIAVFLILDLYYGQLFNLLLEKDIQLWG